MVARIQLVYNQPDEKAELPGFNFEFMRKPYICSQFQQRATRWPVSNLGFAGYWEQKQFELPFDLLICTPT